MAFNSLWAFLCSLLSDVEVVVWAQPSEPLKALVVLQLTYSRKKVRQVRSSLGFFSSLLRFALYWLSNCMTAHNCEKHSTSSFIRKETKKNLLLSRSIISFLTGGRSVSSKTESSNSYSARKIGNKNEMLLKKWPFKWGVTAFWPILYPSHHFTRKQWKGVESAYNGIPARMGRFLRNIFFSSYQRPIKKRRTLIRMSNISLISGKPLKTRMQHTFKLIPKSYLQLSGNIPSATYINLQRSICCTKRTFKNITTRFKKVAKLEAIWF